MKHCPTPWAVAAKLPYYVGSGQSLAVAWQSVGSPWAVWALPCSGTLSRVSPWAVEGR
jgi:hypothetical protein